MSVLIIGGGQAGYQCAASLRSEGYAGSITLVGEEPGLPYQRPPLSKEYLSGSRSDEALWFRPSGFYAQQDIDLVSGVRAEAIDRDAGTVALSDGRRLSYEHLVLATGARNRDLPFPVAEGARVLELRTLSDARALKTAFESATRCAVIGAGYIGLEVAAAARKAGLDVTVIEAQDRVLSRVAPPVISEYFEMLHRNEGVILEFSAMVSKVTGKGVILGDGRNIAADLVVAGIGVAPNVELAETAGLDVENGVKVDKMLRTRDAAIFAIGDCASFPCAAAGCEARLESVQNAADQGRAVAKTICGRGGAYADTPWFWTIQYDVRLQTAGVPGGFDQMVQRGAGAAFSIFYFKDGGLIAVDSVNQPAEHMAARMMLTKGLTPPKELAGDADSDLRGWVMAQG